MTGEYVTEWEDPADLLVALEKAYGIPVRAEYVEEHPVLLPPREDSHDHCASELAFQLHNAGVRPGKGNGYRIGSPGDWSGALVIPDFSVLRREPTAADEARYQAHEGWYPVDLLGLVGEVTSSLHEIDSGPKYRAYASAGVPVYALIHRQAGKAYAFSHPAAGEYTTEVEVEIGHTLPLPTPYPALETAFMVES
ncbi:Uma2 family endonuclease [Streptomyces chattanoogensis]|uniref:Putative restriction endonuclease domain-containing protein n=1 Tax=Streptomyces chattanoogensis TaxID=66876 RepID=A0A0N0GYV6_9ACTN|nr:Uma2 family endonuclease [Streptomyces chattanoogensis]KPC62219.1 hypothetical protein ADL29_20855 [Streptomyces chattanoogensis]